MHAFTEPGRRGIVVWNRHSRGVFTSFARILCVGLEHPHGLYPGHLCAAPVGTSQWCASLWLLELTNRTQDILTFDAIGTQD